MVVVMKWCADCYLTVCAPPGLSSGEAARRVYGKLGEVLAKRGLEPVQEKVYGALRERPAVLKARATALSAHGLDASLPVSYVEGRPVSGAGLAGVQIWALRSGRRGPGAVTTVRHPWGLGRLWTEGRRHFLYLSAVPGTGPEGTWSHSRSVQARRMFLNAQAGLRCHGFEFSDTVRTWIYLRDILDWYGRFNQVRNALYRGPDFFGRSFRNRAPASTGIGGRGAGGDCVMDLLAVQPEARGDADIEWIRRSARQGPAPRYGSAFTRAIVLKHGPTQTIHVSGTASIDAAGDSVGPRDPERQSLHMLLNVAALLEERGAGLEDIATSVLFCKDRRAHEAFLTVCRLLRLPQMPTIAVLADVCRPELEVELEAVAFRGQAHGVRLAG